MPLYFITYDLRKARDYKTLYDELAKFSAVRVLKSTWCFKRDNTNPENLRNYFMGFIDADDGLLVDESVSWATVKAEGTPNDV